MQSISNKEFKAALKTLSRAKKGNGTRQQRDALSIVVGYMGQFPASNKSLGHLFIQVTDIGEYSSSLTGFPDALVTTIAHKAMSSYDMNNLLERVVDKIKETHAEFHKTNKNPVVLEFTHKKRGISVLLANKKNMASQVEDIIKDID
jgi:acetyl-CoA carboxylase carboxyltransferase component